MVNEFVSEKDPKLQVGEDGSSPDVVSSVIIREKTKESKDFRQEK